MLGHMLTIHQRREKCCTAFTTTRTFVDKIYNASQPTPNNTIRAIYKMPLTFLNSTDTQMEKINRVTEKHNQIHAVPHTCDGTEITDLPRHMLNTQRVTTNKK